MPTSSTFLVLNLAKPLVSTARAPCCDMGGGESNWCATAAPGSPATTAPIRRAPRLRWPRALRLSASNPTLRKISANDPKAETDGHLRKSRGRTGRRHGVVVGADDDAARGRGRRIRSPSSALPTTDADGPAVAACCRPDPAVVWPDCSPSVRIDKAKTTWPKAVSRAHRRRKRISSW